MRTLFGRAAATATVAAHLTMWCSAAYALDGDVAAPDAKGPIAAFSNAIQALHEGLAGYRAGDMKSSVEAFKYAAAQGNPLARWKLGRMYADGDGVQQDDFKAFQYFSQIVQNYDEDDSNARDLSVVSNAFVSLGIYDLNGIANSEIKPDPERALEMFQYAALNFGSADAQYNLARLYLDGAPSVPKDVRQAARWMALAADKNHKQAEALLGHMLFNGFEGVPHQRARGLMWLMLAKESATDPKDAWIVELYAKAMASASEADRQVASLYLEDRHRRN
jgi:TPR repeat protein